MATLAVVWVEVAAKPTLNHNCDSTYSFYLNVNTVSSDVVAAFYSPQTRFWELLVGSALAYVTLHKPGLISEFKQRLESVVFVQVLLTKGITLSNIQSLLGASLISIGVLVITKAQAFPGWWAVLPVAGSLLIISAGKQAWLNRTVLSSRVLVWFGLISYPLYLWHWPLLSFASIIEGEFPVVIVSIVLAWLTYVLIEKPIRFGKYAKAKTFTLLIMMTISGYVGYACFIHDGFEFRIKMPPLIDTPHTVQCDGQIPCVFGNLDSKKIIVVYGDSHAGHLTAALNRTVGGEYKIFSFTDGSCFVGEDFHFSDTESDTESKNCKLIKKSIKKMRNENIFAVIRGQRWHGYGIIKEKMIEDAIADASNAFGMHPKKVIISGSTADVDINCEHANYASFFSLRQRNCKSFEESKVINKTFISVTRGMSLSKNIHFVYPYESLCPDDICKMRRGTILYYRDSHHLTEAGAKLVMPNIIRALDN